MQQLICARVANGIKNLACIWYLCAQSVSMEDDESRASEKKSSGGHLKLLSAEQMLESLPILCDMQLGHQIELPGDRGCECACLSTKLFQLSLVCKPFHARVLLAQLPA